MQCKRFCHLLLVAQCLNLVLVMLAPLKAEAAEPHIYISEVGWAGSSLSTADEWLELANPTEQEADIAGWRLTGAGASDKPLVLPTDAKIPAGGIYLIANYPASDAHCSLTMEPGVVTTTISLSNSNLMIRLIDSSSQTIDQAGDGTAPPAGYSSDKKSSMIRTDWTVSGDQKTVWKTADSAQNMKTADLGTPGMLDIPVLTAEPPDEPAITVSDESATSTLGEVTPIDESDPEPTVTETATSTVLSVDATTTSETVTSTVQTLYADEIASSTQSATEYQATSTTATVNAPTSTTIAVSSLTIQPVASNTSYQLIRLNEVMSYPQSGSEWVEITSVAPDRSISLDGLGLYDKTGKIATLKGTLEPTHPYFVHQLTSARLNNTGDAVYLRTPDGQTIDSFLYDSSHRNASWVRDMLGAWQETASPTPGTENTIVTLSTTAKTMPNATATIKTQAQSKAKTQTGLATSSTSSKMTKTTKTSTAKNTTKAAKPASADSAKPKIAAKNETVTAKAKTTTKKVAPKTSAAKPIIDIDFDMLRDDTYGGMRVRLQGLVGTPPRLLTGRSFVLLNQEGRGLLVKLSADKKMPPMNTPLAVVGTLKFDTHELPYLSVAKNDSLMTLKKTASSTIREVAWLAPAAEDAWSLSSVTGTVVSVSGSTILIAADDTEVSAKIKSGVAYRTARLKKGDTIWVSGVLDMSSEKPALLPRTADEIRLLAHAPTKTENVTATATPKGLPGWTPFGAALGAIGAVEGVKKLRSKKKNTKAKPSPNPSLVKERE